MKKLLIITLAFGLAITLTGCGNDNKEQTTDNNDNKSEQSQTQTSYSLSDFENDVKALIPTMQKSEVFYQMVGAIDGFKIYDSTDQTARIEIYKFDKASDEYKKAEADQKLYMNNFSFDATVKNGYAFIIDDEFPEHDKIIELFNKLS